MGFIANRIEKGRHLGLFEWVVIKLLLILIGIFIGAYVSEFVRGYLGNIIGLIVVLWAVMEYRLLKIR